MRVTNEIWVLIPLKEPNQAKSRLIAILPADTRRRLFFAMARQVIRAACGAKGIAGVAVVTPSREVAQFAESHGALALPDAAQDGTAAACAAGIERLVARGAQGVLILPGDLPLARSADLSALVERRADGPCILLVADRRGQGTNALLLHPPGIIPPLFGEASAAAHAEAARRAGARFQTVALPALQLDIDGVEDIAALKACLQRRSDLVQAVDPELRAIVMETDLPPSDG